MKIIEKQWSPAGAHEIHYENGARLTFCTCYPGELNYMVGEKVICWREKGGGWTFSGSNMTKYPCRLAALVARRMTLGSTE
jgi:hypothetical protein